ncbi:MAG: dihydrodipicolinate reductase, partial [Phycisphaerae bacterium]
MIRLAVAGATGRTGHRVVELASRDNRFTLAAALIEPGRSLSGFTMRVGDGDVLASETLDAPCDVLIDFTVAEG